MSHLVSILPGTFLTLTQLSTLTGVYQPTHCHSYSVPCPIRRRQHWGHQYGLITLATRPLHENLLAEIQPPEANPFLECHTLSPRLRHFVRSLHTATNYQARHLDPQQLVLVLICGRVFEFLPT